MKVKPVSKPLSESPDGAMLPARSFAELPAMKYAMPFCGLMRS